MDFDESCRPGIPTAPRALRFELKDGYDLKHKSSLLRWWPSQVFDENGNTSQEHSIIGYRIYVNGLPKGMVKAHKNRALVEGMRIQNEYKITVVAIGSLGDSSHSNAAIIYVPNSEIFAQNINKIKNDRCAKKKNAVSKKSEAGMSVNPKNDTLDEVLDKAAEVLEKVAQSQEAGNDSSESNRDPDFDSKENTFPGSNRNDSESTICPEKYKLSTKVEVESIEDIIRKAKENFKDSQSKIMKSSFENSNEDETENRAKKAYEEEEDYSKLLKDLDEEDDEDIVAKVLKRYGLNKHDFDYALPESSDEKKTEPLLSFQNFMPVHEISLD